MNTYLHSGPEKREKSMKEQGVNRKLQKIELLLKYFCEIKHSTIRVESVHL